MGTCYFLEVGEQPFKVGIKISSGLCIIHENIQKHASKKLVYLTSDNIDNPRPSSVADCGLHPQTKFKKDAFWVHFVKLIAMLLKRSIKMDEIPKVLPAASDKSSFLLRFMKAGASHCSKNLKTFVLDPCLQFVKHGTTYPITDKFKSACPTLLVLCHHILILLFSQSLTQLCAAHYYILQKKSMASTK